MKNRVFIKWCFIVLLFIPHIGISYPWVLFKDTEQKNYLEFDLHSSYFLKDTYSVFSGGNLEYHNTKIDIDVSYYYSFLEKKHYFRFGELSVLFPVVDNHLNMILGFRDFVWSESDRYWNLGLWQPRYLSDAFRPLQNSLPGLYFDYVIGKNTSVALYFSYFYLPDVIIYPDLEDDAVRSKNPYFSSFESQSIQWDVNQLRSFELSSLLQPLFAFQIHHKLPYSEVFLSYAYKPKNQIQFFVESKGISLSESDSVKITITDLDYEIAKHHLFTLESEIYLNSDLSLFASLFYEKPEILTVRESWVSDNFGPHLTASLLAYFKEETKGVEKTIFTLGYLKNFQNNHRAESNNVITKELESVFGTGFDWKHAISWSMEYWTAEIFHGFLFNFRLNYTLDNNTYVAILDTSFQATPLFQIYFAGDVLFRASDEPVGNGTSVISKYKDLSRLLVGVKYVF